MAQTGQWTKVEGWDLKEIIYEKKQTDLGGIARITFNRPERLNALTAVGMQETINALWDTGRDPSIGVVVIAGAGDVAWCVGGDVEWEQSWGDTKGPRDTPSINDAILDCPYPVIAAVKGWCIGGGNHWAYTCDITIAADNAKFGQNGARVGSPHDGWSASYLCEIVGHKRAREIRFLQRRYTAQEAREMGLVNKVVPLDKLEEEVEQWCREILSLSPTVLRLYKASFNAHIAHLRGNKGSFLRVIAPDFDGSEEQREAQKAFFERRPPDFRKFRGR
ncbi:MAG: enoyl-CoA hydratase-related protein [Chloroflexota bacterium]|nr:enoyl-CoA hydratase-related protein [Chloroflexota bacterium]